MLANARGNVLKTLKCIL